MWGPSRSIATLNSASAIISSSSSLLVRVVLLLVELLPDPEPALLLVDPYPFFHRVETVAGAVDVVVDVVATSSLAPVTLTRFFRDLRRKGESCRHSGCVNSVIIAKVV